MFNKNNKENSTPGRNESASINLIGAGTVIKGDIRANGDLRIDGTVQGNVTSRSKIVIGNTGLVEGDVNSQNADVSGSIKGRTNVSELLFLKSSSNVNGDIVTGKLIVEVGATFTGSCNMGPMIKDIKDGDKPAAGLAQEKLPDDKNAYMRYASMGTQMLVIIGLGVFAGFKLDKYFGFKIPVCTLVLSLVSVAGSIYLSIKDFLKKK